MSYRLFRRTMVLMLGAALLCLSAASHAAYPEKPIRLLIGFSAGSGVDLEGRAIAPFLEKILGVPVTVENLPGANGKIALSKVWSAEPDGYSIVVHTATMSAIGQHTMNPEYQVADFAHVYSWSITNQVLVVNAETYKTLDEFLKDAKQRTLSASLPGIGSASHLSGLMLADGMGFKANWVPFSGGGEAAAALAGKHVDFASIAVTSAFPMVKGGKLRPLVMLANKRDPVMPDVPLAKDLGYNFPVLPMLRAADAPPKTPLPIIKTLEAAFAKVVGEPEFIAWADKRKMQIQTLTAAEYGEALLQQIKDIDKYKDILKQK
jgi:tripartite-type tricarboxylate transporter receptor subunit TctC